MSDIRYQQRDNQSQGVYLDHQEDINSEVRTEGIQFGYKVWWTMMVVIGFITAVHGLYPFLIFGVLYMLAHRFVLGYFLEASSWLWCNLWWIVTLSVGLIIAISMMSS